MKHFLVVGAGGTASYLLPGLYRYLASTYGDDFLLQIVDGDHVDEGNLARQAHDGASVGINKARALATQYLPQTQGIAAYLGPKNIDKLIQNGTTVLITVDNFPCRKRIEQHAAKLRDVTVINGGNELHSGSVQLWLRQKGKDKTPPIGFLHPEISMDGEDRATMTCAAIAKLPGGGQTAAANMQTAAFMLSGLITLDQRGDKMPWHELHFDISTGEIDAIDYRDTKAWKSFSAS